MHRSECSRRHGTYPSGTGSTTMVRASSAVIGLGLLLAIVLLPLPIPGLGVVLGLGIAAVGVVLRLLGK